MRQSVGTAAEWFRGADNQTHATSESTHMNKRMRPSECNVSDALQRMMDADNTGAWRARMHTFYRDLHAFTVTVPAAALTDDEFAFVSGLIGEVQDAMQDEAMGGAA